MEKKSMNKHNFVILFINKILLKVNSFAKEETRFAKANTYYIYIYIPPSLLSILSWDVKFIDFHMWCLEKNLILSNKEKKKFFFKIFPREKNIFFKHLAFQDLHLMHLLIKCTNLAKKKKNSENPIFSSNFHDWSKYILFFSFCYYRLVYLL